MKDPAPPAGGSIPAVELKGGRLYIELLRFVTKNKIRPHPREMMTLEDPVVASVYNATELRFDYKRTLRPPVRPFMIPITSVFPKGIPAADRLRAGLHESPHEPKSTGSLRFFFEQNTNIWGWTREAEEDSTLSELEPYVDFQIESEIQPPPFLRTRASKPDPASHCRLKLYAAKVFRTINIDMGARIICSPVGCRVWLIWRPDQKYLSDWAYNTHVPVLNDAPLIAITQEDGDALYIPPGWMHCSWSLAPGYDAIMEVLNEVTVKESVDHLERMFKACKLNEVAPPIGLNPGVAKSVLLLFGDIFGCFMIALRIKSVEAFEQLKRMSILLNGHAKALINIGLCREDHARWLCLMRCVHQEQAKRQAVVSSRKKITPVLNDLIILQVMKQMCPEAVGIDEQLAPHFIFLANYDAL
jgi:hypothetical protein